MNRSFLSFLLCLCLSIVALAQQTGKWGDQRDGTFRNPIIAADFSDPDPIRVGKDYYMTASTFESSPGVSILHSRDLVNWKLLGCVFTDLALVDTAFSTAKMDRYNRGVYAPTLRYHAGKFWVFVNFITDGFWVATAISPKGPWDIKQIKDKQGKPLRTCNWTDPAPFWDEDGKAYLASSNPGSKWFSYLFEMSPDGTQLLDADVDHMQLQNVVYRSTLNAHWSWNHQPRSEMWSLKERKGHLRLYALPTTDGKDSFFKCGNVINQWQMRSDTAVVTVKIDVRTMKEGQKAGLANFNGGVSYSFLGVAVVGDNKQLMYSSNEGTFYGLKLLRNQSVLYICSQVGFDNQQRYQYSFDGKKYISFGKTYTLKVGHYRGNMIGVFTYNNNINKEAGFVDIDWFRYIISHN